MTHVLFWSVVYTVIAALSFTIITSALNETVYYEYNTAQNKFISKQVPGVSKIEIPAAAREAGQVSRSQVGQDEAVLDILGHKKSGFFVDLASNDWKELSNTLQLEMKYDWNGLCIEPNPQYHKQILQNRRCTLVANPVSRMTNDIVKFRFDAVFGGIVGKDMDNKAETATGVVDVSLTTVTLDRVLSAFNAPYEIDYMSLDVEGKLTYLACMYKCHLKTYYNVTVFTL